MIPRKCKRLAEVDFPIAEVSRHAAREKSIRHGHPSTLHLWWARRSLASSRAVLLALLLPDPCDAHCPEDFKQQAREILRAVRLGYEAFARDLNPVACLILKVMLEDIPRHGPGLAEELRRVGGEIKRQAEQELADLYPKDPDGATPIAYLWVRTVRCEAPNYGAELPLMRPFWLCKKAKRKRALRHRVERSAGEPPSVEFEVFGPQADKEVRGGTVTRARATCLCCGAVLPPERVRAQLAAERGGADVILDGGGSADGWGADDGGGDAQAWAGGAIIPP